ncbi:hypothetical protein Btru_010355 [Bulinus truncatus]|nr:hypothetical protein Btru_010355 [Bulinus truncatus]
MGIPMLLLLLLPAVIGGPITWDPDNIPVNTYDDCSSSCTGSNKFNYVVGQTYVYNYEVSTSINMQGASENVAKLDVTAKATIQVLSKCEMVLELSDVTVKRSDPDSPRMLQAEDETFKMALQRNSLRFSYQDGRIDSLCPSEGDESISLNFKRGVLSVFQNSMTQLQNGENLKEIDVAGACPTAYTVTQKGWKSTEITRTKDLLGCSDRQNYRTALKSTPIDVPDTIKSLPLLKGNYKCIQMVSNEGQLSSASCTESLVFRPFSKKESGARTETTQKLTFVSGLPNVNTRKAFVTIRTDLLFDHEEVTEIPERTLWSAREKLTELCRITAQDLPVEVPDVFTDLVYAMRGLKSSLLTDLYEQINRGSICNDNKDRMKKFFMDALPMVETSGSVEVMVQMLLSGDVSSSQADFWLNTLHFVRKPTSDMIKQLLSLIKEEKFQLKSLLPVSSLIKTFCQSGSDCLTNPQVRDILNVLENILDNKCQGKDEKLILTTLRAIGNLGYSDRLANKLKECIQSKNTHMNARVFAAQAYTAVSCSTDREFLIKVFGDVNEDSELRITAYLSVMHCWSEDVLKQVKLVLNSETTNQVSFFVWTHLTNLMESSSPYKKALKEILNDEVLKRKSGINSSKHSGNYEISYFSEKFGLGASAESNVVWSSKSFLPRSSMVNLTVDIFGQSVQLLELGGRVQGLESMLQKFIGSKFFKGGENITEAGTSRCTKKEKMDAMKNEFNTDQDKLTASLYLRMFGHELNFQHYNEKELFALRDKTSGKFGAKETNNDISYSQSIMFLESQMTVPTIAGIPLTLSINGTASLELQANMDLDLKKLKQKTLFDIKPSGAVSISGLMSVKAGQTNAGLKMTTTLHTGTSVTGRIESNDKQFFSVDFDMPEKLMDILEIKTDFFIIHNKNEKQLTMLPEKQMKTTLCTGDMVYKISGYELCGTASYVNTAATDIAPYMPFNGPLLLSLTLQKKDAPKGYKLMIRQVQNTDTSTASITIDSSGSKVDRKINVGYYFDRPQRTLEGELVSPWKKILFKGTYSKENPSSSLFSAHATIDGEEYKILLQTDKKSTKGKVIWAPKLEITRPKNSKLLSYSPEKFTAEGTLELHDEYREMSTQATANIISGDQTSFGSSLKRFFKDGPLEVKAKYINKEKQKTFSGSFHINQKDSYAATFQLLQNDKKSGTQKYEPTILISTPESQKLLLFAGTVDYKEERSLDGEFQIVMEKTMKDPINFNVTFSKKGKGSKYQAKANLKSSFLILNVDGMVDAPLPLRGKKSPISNKWAIDYNLPLIKDRDLKKNKFIITSKTHDLSSKSLTKYITQINLDSKHYPDANFNASLELSFKNSSTNSKLVLTHGTASKDKKGKDNQVLTVVVDLGHQVSESSANITYDLQVLYPPKEIEYQIKGKHEHQLKQKFKLETYAAIVYQKGKTVEVRLMGNDNSKKNSMDVSGSLEVIFPDIVIDNRLTEGGKYKVVTALSQNPEKEYTHTVSLQLNDLKHSLVNKMKKNRDDFSILSVLEVNGDQFRTLTIKASKNVELFEGSVTYMSDTDIYSIGVNTSAMNSKSQAFSWQVTVPERKVQSSVEIGNKKQGESKFKAEIQWDALRDPKQKLSTDFNYVTDKDNGRFDLSLTFTSPFVNHTIYSFRRLSVYNSREIRDELKLVWGRPLDELSYSISGRVPLTFERFEIRGDLVTPLSTLRKLGVGITHKFDGSRYLSSSVNGTYNDDYLIAAVQVKNSGDKMRNELVLSTSLNSSFEFMKNVAISLSHKMDERLYETEALYMRNDEQYSAKMKTTYAKASNNYNLDSSLTLTAPSDLSIFVQVLYSKSLTLTRLNSTARVIQNRDRTAYVTVGATFDKQAEEYDMNIKIDGKWESFSGLDLDFNHNMLKGLSGTGNLVVRTNPAVRSTLSYSGTNLQLRSSYSPYVTEMNVKYENYPFTILLEHKNPKAEDKKISLEGSLNLSDQKEAELELNLITPYENVRNIDLKCKVQNTLETQWKLDSVLSLDTRKKIQIEGNIDTKNWKNLNGKITTPFKEFTRLHFGHSVKVAENNWQFSEGFLEVQPYFNKVKLENNVTLQEPYTAKFYIDLPDLPIKYLKLDVTGNKIRNGYTYDILARYHPNKDLSLKVKTKYNVKRFPQDTAITLNALTPYQILPKLDAKLDIEKEKDNWVGLLEVSSNFITMRLKETVSTSMSYSDLEINSPEFESVAAGVHVDWSDLVGVNLTLSAPSVGRTVMGFKKKSVSWTNFQNRVFGEYNGKELDMDIGLSHDDQQTRAWITYIYPGANSNYFKTSAYRIGQSPADFDVGGFLQVEKYSRPFNISMQYAFTEQILALGTTLETPFTDSVSYYLRRGTETNGKSNVAVYGKYSNDFLIDFSISNHLQRNSIDYSIRNEYLVKGKNNRFGTTVAVKWSDEQRYEAVVDSYFDKKNAKIEFLSVGKKIPVENINIDFWSNIQDFQDVGLTASITKNIENYSGTINLEYMDGNEAKLSFDLSDPNKDSVNVNAVLTLPAVSGYESNTIRYNQVTLEQQVTSDIEVTTGSNERLTGKMVYNNNEMTLALSGPIKEFQSLRLTGQFNERKQQISGNANVRLTRNRPVELTYDISLNDYKPMVMNFKLKSPFAKLRSTSLMIQHEFQNWNLMKTTSKLQLDELGDVDSQMSLKFDSPLNVELKASMTSAIKGWESKKLTFRSEDKDRSHSSHILIGWQQDKEVMLDNKWTMTGSDKNLKLGSSFELSSPFDELQMVKIKLDHTYGPKMISENIQLIHNGQSYLDADLSYQYNTYHNASVNIKSPRPMSLDLKGSADRGKLDGSFKINWDKLSPDSHLEVVSNYHDQSDSQNTDRSFKLKVIHPVRIMGVESTHKISENEVHSASHVTWDEENSNLLGYDINWTNMTTRYHQRYEGDIKMALPQRSVKFQGSYSDAGTILTTTSAFLWNADKDDKKRLTVLTEVENKDNFKRVTLNINLPNMNKQLILNGITKGRYGTTLIDSKAEISYSSDPQKMISIRSLISNYQVESENNYNYTAQFEFQHPKTNSDVKLVSHVAHVEKICSAGGQLSFLTASKERKFIELWSMLDTAKQSMTLKVASPLKTISMQGQVVNFASHKDLTLTTYENEKETTALDMKIDQKRQEIVAEFNYDRDDPTKILKMTGRYVNESAVQITIVSQNGVQTSEGLIAIRLNTSDIIHTRATWRPMLFNDMKNFISSKITAFSYIANEVFNTSVTHIGSDLKSRYLLISQELMTEMEEVFKLMNDELKDFNLQLNTYSTEFRRFTQRNDLHIRDLGDHIKTAFNILIKTLQDVVRSYNMYSITVSRATNDLLAQLKSHPVAERYSHSVQQLVNGLMTVRQVLEKAVNDATEDLDKFSHLSYKAYLEISRSLDQKLQSYSRSVYELPLHQRMIKQMELLGQQGLQTFPGWTQFYNTLYIKYHQILQEQFHDVMARSEFQHAYALLNEVHQQITYWNSVQKLDKAAQHIVEMSKNILLLELVQIRKTLMNSKIIAYDPAGGELQLEIHLPFTLESLKDKPKVSADSLVGVVRKWANSNLPENLPVLLNNYYDSLPSLSPSSWVPSFKTSAYLVGGKHIFTFDQVNYDFLSHCSYVLARDMLHDNFSVIFNYEKRSRGNPVKSLCFTIEETLNFEISDEYKLKVQGRDTEMPFVTDKVKISRDGDFMNVEYAGGLEVSSNPKLDLYRFTVDNWYHGRVKGMLGHYDNEAVNDVALEKDFDNFEVGKKSCTVKSLPNTVTVNNNDKCFEVFYSFPRFSSCFNKVNPSPFIKICQTYKQTKDEDDAIYLATEQYRLMCQDQGVYIGALSDYVTCNSDGPLIIDGTDPLYQTADVLFLVEDNSCNQWATSSLANIVTELNKVLNLAGKKNNQFGMISYGGATEEAAVRTINGQHFEEASYFLKALETLRFSNNETQGDLISAVQLAMNYPYRTGVAKAIIAIPCSACDIGFFQKNSFTSDLTSKGFNFHLLRKQSVIPDGAKAITNKKYKIYGIDNSKIFTTSGEEQVTTEYLDYLTDCDDLATYSAGSIFDSSFMKEGRKTQSEFIKTFTQRVGWSTKLPTCQNCECDTDSGRVQCELCYPDNGFFSSSS